MRNIVGLGHLRRSRLIVMYKKTGGERDREKTIKIFHPKADIHALLVIALVCMFSVSAAEGADKSTDLMKTREQTRTIQQPTTTQQKGDTTPKQYNRMDAQDRLSRVVCGGVDLNGSQVGLQRGSSAPAATW